MLCDGVSVYTHPHANRLSSVVRSPSSFSFAYNGLGDRLQQTAAGITTTYTLDLNNPFAQVLSDGANSYLYGLGHIGEEQPSGWAY